MRQLAVTCRISAVRKNHSILEICKTAEIAAEVTITAAEKLDVDAAIIFADLLLPLESLGMPFRFEAGEGPVSNVRCALERYRALVTNRAAELGYVAESVSRVVRHSVTSCRSSAFAARLHAGQLHIEGGGSPVTSIQKNEYTQPLRGRSLMRKLLKFLPLTPRSRSRPAPTPSDFDSWVGCLSVEIIASTYCRSRPDLVTRLRKTGVPIIYFGTDTATLLPAMKETGADVIGVELALPA